MDYKDARKDQQEAATLAPMIDAASTYPLVKTVHVVCVACSVTLFAARWLGVLCACVWPMDRPARIGSVAIDTLLLSAGVSLWVMGGWHPWHTPWLGAKLLALVGYVLLGSWALKRAPTRTAKLAFGLAALGVAAYMVGVALRHHPVSWGYGW